MNRRGLPKRQRLIGLWLLLSGISFLGGAIFAALLDAQLAPQGWQRWVLWLGSFSGGATIFLVGLLLERMLFTPLRHLQVQLARLVANPDARNEHPPEGWLKGLGPDLRRVHESWQADRSRLATAHTEGARSAARIRQELETLLQVLETPLLLCDQHRRVMLFNQAAEDFFHDQDGLGLGKRLESLVPSPSLQHAMSQLPQDGSPRELLAPCDERWLKILLRRVPGSEGETLLTFTDATASWSNEMGVRADLAAMLTPLRQHTASLISAADALIQLRQQGDRSVELCERLEGVIQSEGTTLGDNVARIGQLLDDMQHQGERLSPMWSNDFWQALDERRDVDVGDRAAVLRPDLHRRRVGDHPFAPVARQVIVDAPLDRLQQGRLAVVAAADDQRDPARHAQAADRAPVRPVERDRQAVGRLERHRAAGHRPVVDAGAPRQHRAIGDESDQPPVAQLIAQGVGVLRAGHMVQQPGFVVRLGHEGVLDQGGYILEQHLLRLPPQHAAPARRQAGDEARLDPAVAAGEDGGTLQDLLARLVHRQ